MVLHTKMDLGYPGSYWKEGREKREEGAPSAVMTLIPALCALR